jgi:hypothetical protein
MIIDRLNADILRRLQDRLRLLIGQVDEWTAPGGSEEFKVGDIFISTLSENPAIRKGYGTWVAFGSGRMLVGVNSGDADFDTAEETGGAKTVTLTEAQMPAHAHQQRRNATSTGGTSGITTAPDTSSSNPQALGPVTGTTGEGAAHPNMPPYIVVYFWKRTA